MLGSRKAHILGALALVLVGCPDEAQKKQSKSARRDGLWTDAGTIPQSYLEARATLLPSGKVFVSGTGASPLPTSYDPSSGTWTSLNPMPNPNLVGATQTLLPDGRVLLIGKDTADIYDPGTNSWSDAGILLPSRDSHSATLLDSGKVLVVGGTANELFDPSNGAWSPAAALPGALTFHSATKLNDGRVLVAGGFVQGTPSAAAHIYDPQSNTWAPIPSMPMDRVSHVAIRLSSGAVLIFGGTANPPTSSVLYDPLANAWSDGGMLHEPRRNAPPVVLPSGEVFVAGGTDVLAGKSAELFQPVTQTWSFTNPLTSARANHAAALLQSGKVLVAGGATQPNSAELYDPSLGITCTTAADCGASQPHCVKGLCCTEACTGACAACDLPGFTGICRPRGIGTELPACAPYTCGGGDGCFKACGGPFLCQTGFVCSPTSRCLDPDAGAVGRECNTSDECVSGFCVDGFCCDSYCGGGKANDCQACSVDAGGAVDGTCTLFPAGVLCRTANANLVCDAPEVCVGDAGTCPPDVGVALGTICRPAAGPCDVAERCDGTPRTCPAEDALEDAGTICRPSLSACDFDERCTGSDAGCPPDRVAGRFTICRPSSSMDVCDPEEQCSGSSGICPDDVKLQNGTGCGTSLVCQQGACVTDPTPLPDAGNSNPPTRGCGCGEVGGLLPALAALTLVLRRSARRAAMRGPPG